MKSSGAFRYTGNFYSTRKEPCMAKKGKREMLPGKRVLHDPVKDKLTPIEPLDLSQVNTVDDLVRAMGQTAYTGRQVGDSADVLEAMARDKDCFVVLTLAGALTVGKMGLIICDLIDSGVVNAIVSTGALMAHGLVEAAGLKHYRYDGKVRDEELFQQGYNRVYDSLEPEINLEHVEDIVEEILKGWNPEGPVSSWALNRRIGEYLAERYDERGVLLSAYKKDVPVYIPAFTDSEYGLDLALHNLQQKKDGKAELQFDPYLDLEHFTQTMVKNERIGIFTLGGGVPRNWAQQFGVFVDLRTRRLLDKFPFMRYRYGVRICPEPVHWGGLSGSSYSEAVSWGKFVPPEEGGRLAECFLDATVGLPLVAGAVLERLRYFK
jgi:deoxyhypusine synthase